MAWWDEQVPSSSFLPFTFSEMSCFQLRHLNCLPGAASPKQAVSTLGAVCQREDRVWIFLLAAKGIQVADECCLLWYVMALQS